MAISIGMAALLESSCSMHASTVKPSQATIASIGLPVYPHARPIQGSSIAQDMWVIHVNTVSVNFLTPDPMEKVVAFYQARLPKTAQRVTVPMGFATDVTFQFFEGPYQKQVAIVSIKDMRMISLRSIQLLQTPAPSASP